MIFFWNAGFGGWWPTVFQETSDWQVDSFLFPAGGPHTVRTSNTREDNRVRRAWNAACLAVMPVVSSEKD
jgi:hypothetical protein